MASKTIYKNIESKSTAEGKVQLINVSFSEIFNNIAEENVPVDITEYNIILKEIQSVRIMATDYHVDTELSDGSMIVKFNVINGAEFSPAENILRLDFMIKSSNYEDLRLTLYITG